MTSENHFHARNGRFPFAFSWEKTVCTLYHHDGQFLFNNTPKSSWVRFSHGLKNSWVDQIFPPYVGNSNNTYILRLKWFFCCLWKNHFCSHQVNNFNRKNIIERFLFVFCFFLSMRYFKTIAVSPRELTILFPRELIWNTFVMGYQPGSTHRL